ncbi:uncharacterized protein [Brachyistius frenatus]|uniref:uncharacterized protein isoform X1 n=1 Tax=Brachyistius frenatus TaxID=100188 RepID=UPI0037E94CE6
MEVKNKSKTVTSDGNSSRMVDPDLRGQLLHTVQQRNVSTAAATRPSWAEDSLTRSSGIIPVCVTDAEEVQSCNLVLMCFDIQLSSGQDDIVRLQPQCSLRFYSDSMLSSGSAWCRHRHGSKAK